MSNQYRIVKEYSSSHVVEVTGTYIEAETVAEAKACAESVGFKVIGGSELGKEVTVNGDYIS